MPDSVSRDISYCNHWKFREKKFLNSARHFFFIMKVKEVLNIGFYERKKKIITKNMNFARKEKLILLIFRMKKILISWISRSKRRSS